MTALTITNTEWKDGVPIANTVVSAVPGPAYFEDLAGVWTAEGITPTTITDGGGASSLTLPDVAVGFPDWVPWEYHAASGDVYTGTIGTLSGSHALNDLLDTHGWALKRTHTIPSLL